jgi:hypothetical protein
VLQASLNFIDFRYYLVNVESWFIAEANVLLDAVETRQSVNATNYVTIAILDVGHGYDGHHEEDAKTGKSWPLPDET